MKPRQIKLPSSGYRSPWLSYWTVAGVMALLLFMEYLQGIHTSPDTETYYSAGDLLFSGGVIDEIRTPVYPFILHILKTVFGFKGSQYAVMVLQSIIFSLSVIYLNKSVRLIAPECIRLCFWTTLFYVIYPDCGHKWVKYILTESFAISLTVFLTYCVICAAHARYKVYPRYAVWSFVWLLLLVFIRPVMLCYVPVAALFWLILYLKHRRAVLKSFLWGISGIAVIILLVMGYSYEMNRRYHIHSFSFVSVINNYGTLRHGGIITPDDTDDPTLKKFIEECIAIKADGLNTAELWKEMELISDFPHPLVEEAVNHAIKTKPKSTLLSIYRRFRYELDSSIKSVIYIDTLMLLVGAMLLIDSYRCRRISIAPFTLYLFVVSLLSATYVGTMAEWQRIMAPILPMLTLLVGWASSKLLLTPTSDWSRKDK